MADYYLSCLHGILVFIFVCIASSQQPVSTQPQQEGHGKKKSSVKIKGLNVFIRSSSGVPDQEIQSHLLSVRKSEPGKL
jgi:hypothetical protein